MNRFFLQLKSNISSTALSDILQTFGNSSETELRCFVTLFFIFTFDNFVKLNVPFVKLPFRGQNRLKFIVFSIPKLINLAQTSSKELVRTSLGTRWLKLLSQDSFADNASHPQLSLSNFGSFSYYLSGNYPWHPLCFPDYTMLKTYSLLWSSVAKLRWRN